MITYEAFTYIDLLSKCGPPSSQFIPKIVIKGEGTKIHNELIPLTNNPSDDKTENSIV